MSQMVLNKTGPLTKFKLQNVAKERDDTTDVLHTKALEPVRCTQGQCMGSLMEAGLRSTATRPRDELRRHAQDFIAQYYTSIKQHNSPEHVQRWQEVDRSIQTTGTYDLTLAELTLGAKTAWRNTSRCIGRIHWSQIQVFDARHVTTARGMFDAICNHMKYGTNGGNLRSAITVFPPRTDGKHDFRVWNSQLVRYAGYQQDDGSVVGDPANVEITQICEKLGWRGKGTRFDVLPLVLQADGDDPEMFDIPSDLVLEVPLSHPKLPWFADLGLRWYALPAVSCIIFDCGGLEFTCAPFSGWYMGTEVGARDLCDVHRYNVIEEVAAAMGIDTKRNASLWRDQVLVDVNIAVLHSYQSRGVTMVDHHTAAKSFMKHLDNEQRLRGGCPADWVWVVPPMSGSILPVFHQEMLNYKLKPSYENQPDAWKSHVWKRHKEWNEKALPSGHWRKLRLRELALVVLFGSILMRKVLSKRVKCTILYGTETGTSEDFAKTLHNTFKCAFDAKVLCMDEYEVSRLDSETIVLVVVSTFGNGDPPGQGEVFGKSLFELKHPESGKDKRNRQTLSLRPSNTDSPLTIRKYIADNRTVGKPRLNTIRYSVFALGSSTYPKYCAFGHYVNNMLLALGASQLTKVGEGDEQCGQEDSFRAWAAATFTAACEMYGIDRTLMKAAVGTLAQNQCWSPDTSRLTPVVGGREPGVLEALSTIHGKTILTCKLKDITQLQSPSSDRQTVLVKLDTEGSSELMYSSGDHLAVYPENSANLVEKLLARLHKAPPADQLVRLEMLNERTTPHGVTKAWDKWTKLPACSLRTAFLRYLDITTPPSQAMLALLATLASKDSDRESLKSLATDGSQYDQWRQEYYPSVVHVLDQFPSLQVPPSLLLAELPALQVRYYSISSSAKFVPAEIHVTVAVVNYRTTGTLHEGVCSTWLGRLEKGATVPCFIRHVSHFHMPEDGTRPMIMVGPGTGIAPFRSFWQQRKIDLDMKQEPRRGTTKGWGDIYLYFGCRRSDMDHVYKKELEQMKRAGVLKDVIVALSREPNVPKTYVQNTLKQNAAQVYRTIVKEGGHFYVCGDIHMASDVTSVLEKIFMSQGKMKAQDAKNCVLKLRDDGRYHEDTFGLKVRTSQVSGTSRTQPKMARQTNGIHVTRISIRP